MSYISYIVIGTSIVIVGAGIYYLIKKSKGSTVYPIDYKEVDVIQMKHIGDWLKTTDVDMEDFGKTRHIYVIQNIGNNISNVKLSKELKEKIDLAEDKKVLAFVLSDNDGNTKAAAVVIGNEIDRKFESSLKGEVTEININWS